MTSPTLPTFAAEARARVRQGYYDLKALPEFCPPREPPSLRRAIEAPGPFPVIAEVKPASPTAGAMRAGADAGALARAFAGAGARGVSVLVERERFGGSPESVIAATAAGVPVLFKDFVVSEAQLKAARRCGASAVLLILDLHENGEADGCAESFIARAQGLGLEVLLEVYDECGFARAMETGADLIGVNNRDLRAPGLPVDASRTARVLAASPGKDRPVLALSGVASREDLRAVAAGGADGALIGSVLMKAEDPAATLRDLLW